MGLDSQREKATHLVYNTHGVLKVCLPDPQLMGFIGKETLCIVLFVKHFEIHSNTFFFLEP